MLVRKAGTQKEHSNAEGKLMDAIDDWTKDPIRKNWHKVIRASDAHYLAHRKK